ncbi:uncharacterized protein LOC132639647 [Lycium barbarum]|uniref:uncharacterized protein LOC132639647 n=1 Tax=Lycium barbarum TaxID=112863 RepID=UPI00293EEDD2|nr:uncharacterized protein LOC132639647 [Lycium barbarum]
MAMEEEVAKPYSGWRLFFDGAVNYKGSGIGVVLISETGQHSPMATKLNFRCTNNMAEYEACILGLRMALDLNIQELLVIGDSDLLIKQVKGNWETKNDKILPYVNLVQRLCGRFKSIDFRHTPRAQNEFADALATIASMIQHPESSHIDPLEITLRENQAHCAHVEAELDGQPRFFFHRAGNTPATGLPTAKAKSKVSPVERDQKVHRANECKCKSDQEGQTKSEEQRYI